MNKFDEFQNTQLNSFLSHESQLKQAFEAGQQQYKSIVKAVDPDNLPDDREVLAISKDREFLFGHLCSGKSVCENEYFFWCESLGDAVYEVTHYIETKDIIKLLG